MKYNILVTGCGGDIGQSVGKILRSSSLTAKLLGCDLNDEHAGKFIFDQVICIASCRSPDYMNDLERVIVEHQIDIVLPVSEPELRYFSEINLNDQLFGKWVIKPNERALQVGFDKLATADFLKEHYLLFPESHIVKDLNDPVLPIIMKSRDGSGSKSLFIIRDANDWSYYSAKFPHFLAQELVGSEKEEFTCGLFRSAKGEIRHIIYKRRLLGGFSGYGSVETDSSISELLIQIANSLELVGSINVQLRTTEKGPCVFEINPRFSSTVMFRHMMGFEDVIWSIQDKLSLPLQTYQPDAVQKKFYKGFQEYVD